MNTNIVYRVPGTDFLLDSFPRDPSVGCKYFFLSHFHSDHYGGISKKRLSGDKKLVCSTITARLVRQIFHLAPESILIMDPGAEHTINGVLVMATKANHCPGSLIFVFIMKKKKYVYTGDFRFCNSMKEDKALKLGRNCDILYLDSTFGAEKYRFPPQKETVSYIADNIKKEMERGDEALFLIGSYTIGKERIVIEVANKCKCKIVVSEDKMKILKNLEGELDTAIFTCDEEASPVRFVSGQLTSVKYLKENFEDVLQGTQYKKIYVFSPTGWNGNKCSSYWADEAKRIRMFKVPYSEHSNFLELREMVKLLHPKRIVYTAAPPGKKNDIDSMKRRFASLCDNSKNFGTLIPFLTQTKRVKKEK